MKKESIKIAYVGELDRTYHSPDHLGIRQGLHYFNGLVVDPVLHGDDYAINEINNFQPDIIIHGNTDSLSRMLGARMKRVCKAKQVFWMLDYQPDKEHYIFWNEWIKDQNYDAIFLSNRDQLSLWEGGFNCPVHYLTHGCVVQPLKRDDNFNEGVIFIGSNTNNDWYAERFKLLEDIQRLYDFKIFTGNGVDGRNKVWKDMPFIYHSSDCVLDISHTWRADGYASGRFFYTGGLGACSITKRFPGCEELYPEGTKAYFDTPEECVELIKYYRSHKKEREKMKKDAWEWNKKHHHYKFKFKEIIEKVC